MMVERVGRPLKDERSVVLQLGAQPPDVLNGVDNVTCWKPAKPGQPQGSHRLANGGLTGRDPVDMTTDRDRAVAPDKDRFDLQRLGPEAHENGAALGG